MASQELVDRLKAAEATSIGQDTALFGIIESLQARNVELVAQVAAEATGNDVLTQLVADEEAANVEVQARIDALGASIAAKI